MYATAPFRTVMATAVAATLTLVTAAGLAQPDMHPGAPATPGATQAFNAWVNATSGSTHFSDEAHKTAEEIVRREAWPAWPEVTSGGIVYRLDAQVAAPAEACQLTAALVAARVGSMLLDHDVRRPIEIILSCKDSNATAQWAPPAGSHKGRMTASVAPAGAVAHQPVSAPWEYVPTTARPAGADFEVEFLARTPFEENPRRTLDYAGATREDWFSRHSAEAAKLECWASLWGSYNRQCTLRLPNLQPRQCAALGLYAGYRDLLKRVNEGLSPKHSFEIMAWCGDNRAHIRFTRNQHVLVEWFRKGEASSEMSTTIARRHPIALTPGQGARARFASDVEARDRDYPNRFDEMARRAGAVAKWFGAEGAVDAKGVLDAVARDVTCSPNTVSGGTMICRVARPVGGVAPGATCRIAAFSAAMALPLAKAGPIQGQRDFELTLACDQEGRVVRVTREMDFMQMVETHPDNAPSELKASKSDTIDVWAAEFDILRDVH